MRILKTLTFTLSTAFLCASCAEQYNIAGSSSVQCLDGRMLYLRVSDDGLRSERLEQSSLINLDSCKVVHGRFQFEGDIDTVRMAMLYTNNDCVMPLIIENGNLSIQLDNVCQYVSGSPLNDKLYSFFKKRNSLDSELWELQQKALRMMREGCTPEEINRKIGKKASRLARTTEELETKFVKENYHNVLGPGFFMLLSSQYPTPVITSQIESILKDAPEAFLNDPYVSNYITRAYARGSMRVGTVETTVTMGFP